MLVNVPFDIFVSLSEFLTPDEIAITTSTCRTLWDMQRSLQLWSSIGRRANKKLVSSLLTHLIIGYNQGDSVSVEHQIEVARQVARINSMKRVRWRKPEYIERTKETNHSKLERMEAHTMTSFLDRYLLVVGGWAGSRENEIDIIDGAALPQRLVLLSTSTSNVPGFRYGFSSVVYNNKLIVYGGCRSGGYSADCNGK